MIDISILLLRIIVSLVFADSGRRDLMSPKMRGESMGIGAFGAVVLGSVEVISSVMLVLGIFPKIAALALIIVMLGAIYKKIFIWKTGFWGGKSYGWHYDLTYLLINLLIFATAGGKFTLINGF